MEKYKKQINTVIKELESALDKHPEYPEDPIHQVAIIEEESGEAIRAALQHQYEGGDVSDIDEEVVQVAAMALRYLIENKVI